MPGVHPHKENSQSTSKLNQICANFQTEFEYVIYFHARRRNRRSRHEFDPIWVDFYFIAWVFGHRMSIMSNFSIGNALNNRFRTGNSKCSIKKKTRKRFEKGTRKTYSHVRTASRRSNFDFAQTGTLFSFYRFELLFRQAKNRREIEGKEEEKDEHVIKEKEKSLLITIDRQTHRILKFFFFPFIVRATKNIRNRERQREKTVKCDDEWTREIHNLWHRKQCQIYLWFDLACQRMA